MKNSLNLVLVIFAFIVIACSCPNLKDLDKKSSGDTPTTSSNSSTTSSNTATAPKKDDSKSDDGLTLENYNKIKNGMSYDEVKSIIGSPGTETMSSGSGKYKVESYQWKGDGFKFLSIVLSGGKVTSKTQANLE
jgi:outer membrane protein assembly factor BamE (lipoprotein component of BamABCDE complex)